ncbi:MAG: radical SAM protein, partial [Myxococcales bacterium]|nr:radical SAM protein [Myxococcales bacterium]
MKALIKVGYACNEHCSFCHTLEVRHIDGPTAEIDAKIRRAAALGHSMVVLSGGEPTIRPELMHWARLTASLGLDFGLVTNGQMLAYPQIVEPLLANRLRYVYLSLHGGTPKVHNLMVRSDAFDNAFAAVRNLAGRGLDFSVNCVITRHNVEHLKGLVDLLLPYPDLMVKFSMVEPKGGGDKLFRHLMPRVEHVARRVHEAITYGLERAAGRGPRFTHGAIPLCLLPGLEDLFDDLKTHQYRTMIEVGERDFFPVDDRNKTHTEKCRGCALQGPCPGLYRGYQEEYGDDELRPVTGRPRSNSFNYRLEGRLAATDAERCPLLDGLGVTPWDRARSLFVKNGARLARYRAETRDFSDGELEVIKHERGQIYVDVSRKDAPDDFARDLVQLRRSALCDGCAERNHCTGLFEPVFEDVFSRDDERVRALLRELTGDVLDVGCGGGGRYDALLGDLAAAGTIRYVGVEPDPGHAAAIRAARPWAEIRAVALEDLDGDDRYDHVLALRSWNHFADGAAALARLVALARPGGVVTIVDNVAFGLVRTRGQSARAEAGPARFEHHRNDGLGDVDRLAVAAGLTRLD